MNPAPVCRDDLQKSRFGGIFTFTTSYWAVVSDENQNCEQQCVPVESFYKKNKTTFLMWYCTCL